MKPTPDRVCDRCHIDLRGRRAFFVLRAGKQVRLCESCVPRPRGTHQVVIHGGSK